MPAVNYLWDPILDNIVREFDDDGNVIADYTHEPGLHGNLISQHRDGKSYFYHYDGQGNTLALTDENGDITDRYAYSAFGEVTEHTGDTVNPFQFGGEKGYYRDEETGDYHVGQRPLTTDGRWLSAKPANTDAMKAYVLANNSPTNLFDPSGLQSQRSGKATSVKEKRLDSPNFQVATATCGGCGNYNLTWIIEPAVPESRFYVQFLCFFFDIESCKESPNCTGGRTCVPAGIVQKKQCCIMELLGVGGPANGATPPAKDNWKFETKNPGSCIAKGYASHSTTVFGFPPDSDSAKAISGWKHWQGGAENAFQCGDLTFKVGKFFPVTGAFPDDVRKVLSKSNTDLVEWGNATLFHEFDCCPIRDGIRGSLQLLIKGGVGQGDYTGKCGGAGEIDLVKK